MRTTGAAAQLLWTGDGDSDGRRQSPFCHICDQLLLTPTNNDARGRGKREGLRASARSQPTDKALVQYPGRCRRRGWFWAWTRRCATRRYEAWCHRQFTREILQMLICQSDMSITVAAGFLFPYFGTRKATRVLGSFERSLACLLLLPPCRTHHITSPAKGPPKGGKKRGDVMNHAGGSRGGMNMH